MLSRQMAGYGRQTVGIGLKYELVGDYYLVADDDEPPNRSIGIWGQKSSIAN